MVLLSEAVRAAIDELRRRCGERFGSRLHDVVLFGSHARGEAGPDSDVDVLVVVEGLSPRERRVVYELGAETWMDTGVRIAPLALSDAEVAELRRLERLIIADIDREGVPV